MCGRSARSEGLDSWFTLFEVASDLESKQVGAHTNFELLAEVEPLKCRSGKRVKFLSELLPIASWLRPIPSRTDDVFIREQHLRHVAIRQGRFCYQ